MPQKTVARTRIDVDWVRSVLDRGWGPEWSRAPLHPVADWQGRKTEGTWLVHAKAAPHVLRVRLGPEERVHPDLFPLRQQVLAHCRRRGLPVPDPVPTTDGGTVAWREDLACELTPVVRAAVPFHPGPEQTAAVIRTGLALRATLDGLPPHLVTGLAALPCPRPCWRQALAEAADLLPLANSRADDWSRACAAMLRGALAAVPLLATPLPPHQPAVVHGSLRTGQFQLSGGRDPQVLAVEDFGALHAGDRLLDLAALADTAARVRVGETARRRALALFLDLAHRHGLLADGQERHLMPVLLATTVPPLVALVRQVLLEHRRGPGLVDRFDLLDPTHQAAVHRLLTGPGS